MISQALWPYSRPIIYEIVEIFSAQCLHRFLRTIAGQVEIAAAVKRLTITLEREPAEVQHHATLPIEASTFWGAFTRLFKLDLMGCFNLTSSLLELGPDSGVHLSALEMIDLRGDWDEWPNPYAPRHYQNVFTLAPNLRSFQLIVRRELNSARTTGSAKKKKGAVRLTDALAKVILIGPITRMAGEVAELCHAFGAIEDLGLYEQHPPMDLSPLFRKLSGLRIDKLHFSLQVDEPFERINASNPYPNLRHLTSIRHVSIDLPFIFDDDMISALPPSLTTIALDSNYRVVPPILLRDLQTELHKLPHLRSIQIDALPGMAYRLADAAARGPKIMRPAGPVLRADDGGEPIFAPLPGWRLPAFNSDPVMSGLGDEFRAMVRAIKVARERSVELKGHLVEATRIRQEWEAERELCRALQEEYDEGELEWDEWTSEEEDGALDSSEGDSSSGEDEDGTEGDSAVREDDGDE